MGARNAVVAVIVFGILLTATLVLINSYQSKKLAFVYNEKLFKGFRGTTELDKKLKDLEIVNRERLDSLIKLPMSPDLESQIRDESFRVDGVLKEVSTRYTEDIWNHINEAVSAFGKENGYDFVFGAAGDGSLMYADEVNDITEEVLDYMNSRYDGSK